jgi:hypothetical protein
MPDSGFHPNSDRPVYRETPATEKEKGEASLFQAPGFIRGVLIFELERLRSPYSSSLRDASRFFMPVGLYGHPTAGVTAG